MGVAHLILGSNLGVKQVQLEKGLQAIALHAGKILQTSSVYETEPWGDLTQPSFYNQVVVIETAFNPEELMTLLLEIESGMGRKRTIGNRNASRDIDIDILFYENVVMASELLTIPHPRLHLRKFVLQPLVEVAPNLMHPLLDCTVAQLFERCNDTLSVTKIY